MGKKSGRTGITITGVGIIIKALEASEKNTHSAIEKALVKSGKPIEADMLEFMSRHMLTGDAYRSLTEYPIKWDGEKAEYRIGFSVKEGGLPAIFLNVGTPTIAPSFFIEKAVDKNNAERMKIFKDTLNEVLSEVL